MQRGQSKIITKSAVTQTLTYCIEGVHATNEGVYIARVGIRVCD